MPRFRSPLVFATLTALLMLSAMGPRAAANEAGATYSQETVIAIPGASLDSFDLGFVDSTARRYYLADRSNKGVDIIDSEEGNYLSRLGGFVGFTGNNDTSGPNGITLVRDKDELWAGDGNSTVKVFDLAAGTIVASISTGGTARADEIAYDPRDHLILVANDADSPPFVSFIDTATRTVVAKISFPDATNGIEQPVWDPATDRFYLSLPQVGADPLDGGIAVLDPHELDLEKVYPVEGCQPAGLALGPNDHLALGCSGGPAITAGAVPQIQIMEASSGDIEAVITQVGGADQVWFNPGDGRYYVAARNMPGGPVLGVIDAVTNAWITNFPTGPNSHSVAADAGNNHVFVPLKGKGVGVYEAGN